MSKKTAQAKRDERRKTVAYNLLAGATYRTMAEALDVSVGTIANDVRIILGRWQRETLEAVDEWAQLQLQRYEKMLNGIWPKAADGDLAAIDKACKIMEAEAKILNLFTTEAIVNTVVNNVQGVTGDTLAEAMRELDEWQTDDSDGDGDSDGQQTVNGTAGSRVPEVPAGPGLFSP